MKDPDPEPTAQMSDRIWVSSTAEFADTIMVVYSVPLLFLGIGPTLGGWFSSPHVLVRGILLLSIAILGINAANRPAQSKLRVIWACFVLAGLTAEAIELGISGDTLSLVGSAVCATIALGLVPVFYSAISSRRIRQESIVSRQSH